MSLVNVIGFAGAVVSFVLFIPQAMRTYSVRNDPRALSAISVGTQALLICNAVLWFAYGYLTSAFWVAAPGFVNLPLAVLTIVLVLQARRGTSQGRVAQDERCALCVSGVEHRVFVRGPAGWGSVVPCNGITAPYELFRPVRVTSTEQIKALRSNP